MPWRCAGRKSSHSRARLRRAGQAGHFLNAAPVKDVYAARRYIDEANRLLSVYETQLSQGDGRDYLVGPGRGKFSYVRIVSDSHLYQKCHSD